MKYEFKNSDGTNGGKCGRGNAQNAEQGCRRSLKCERRWEMLKEKCERKMGRWLSGKQ